MSADLPPRVWLTRNCRTTIFESFCSPELLRRQEDLIISPRKYCLRPFLSLNEPRTFAERLGFIGKVTGKITREKPDLVHTHTAKAGTIGRVAGFFYRWLSLGTLIGKPRRVKLVHTYHGHVFHSYYGNVKTKIFLFIEKTLARIATDKIIVISRQQFEEIHEKFGVGRVRQFATFRPD